MIPLNFWFFCVFALPFWFYQRRKSYRKNRGHIDPLREVILNLFFVYGLGVAYFTFPDGFFPFAMKSFNFNVFVALMDLWHRPLIAVINILGNVVLFIPLGIFIPLLDERFHSLVKMGLLGLGCSAGIEVIQYLSGSSRAADIDDIILNTIGAAIGYGFFALAKSLNKPRPAP
ncbi:VanZ like family protein [Moorella thermoacetica]|uniref:VanZ like family protein n=1 Tax=Neomoorella thermoacetica TaxID=1525 RepID=A0A1J5NJ49_NEOTH|nr:VanZ like family protein [Moorella thermoacetica]